MMIVFEMHGLMDCAAELASTFRDRLMTRLDVDRAIDLLLGPPPHARNLPEIVACLATIAQLRAALEAKPDSSRRVGLPVEPASGEAEQALGHEDHHQDEDDAQRNEIGKLRRWGC